MPLQTNVRLGYSGRLSRSIPGENTWFSPLTSIDAVYGYRSKLREGAGSTEQEVYNPPRGSLVEQLRYRKEFLERQVSAILQDSGTSNFLTEDRGHPFSVSHSRVKYHTAKMSYPTYGVSQDVSLPLSQQFTYTRSNGATGSTTGLASLLPVSWSNSGLGNQLKSTFPVLPASDMRAMGTEWIARTWPNTPYAQSAVALLELLQPGGIPTMARSLRQLLQSITTRKSVYGIKDIPDLARKSGSAAGDTYLEYAFGWVPLINDIKAFANALALIDGLIFDGESTRRSRRSEWITLQSSSRQTVAGGFFGPLYPAKSKPWVQSVVGAWSAPNYSCNFVSDYSTLIGYDVRFSGRFSKPARPTERFNGYLDRYYHFLGLEITPEVVWEITSWSWLLDWFSNLGGVAQNLSAWQTSGYRLDYGYITLRVNSTFSAMANSFVPAPGLIVDGLPWSIVTREEKYRMPASPFGFAVDTSGLNPTQWSILVALGLARGK